MSSTSTQSSAVKAAKVSVSELESMLSESPSPDRVCLKVAQMLRVRRSEVALLRLDKGSLRFIFPPELQSARRTAPDRNGGGGTDGSDSHSPAIECLQARKTCQPV